MNKGILSQRLVITAGVMGFLFALLGKLGNAANMGICVLCFYRDIAGAIGLHKIAALSYIRPEIIGFILGGTIFAVIKKSFQTVGGANLFVRLIIGILIGYNALIFLGCPIRMFGRISSGDWTALSGLAGVIVAVIVFKLFVKNGFFMGRSTALKKESPIGLVTPVFAIILLVLLFWDPTGINKRYTTHAPIFIALGAGILLGLLGQWSLYCSLGAAVDIVLLKSYHRILEPITFLLIALLANLFFGQFKPGAHPVAHTANLWNFLSMFVIGLGSVMLGGCPFKQTILASKGNVDAFISIIGIFIGISIGHNFSLAASPKGVPITGMIGVIISLLIILFIGFTSKEKQK